MESGERIALFIGGPIDGQRWRMTEEEWTNAIVSVEGVEDPPPPRAPFRPAPTAVSLVLRIPPRVVYRRRQYPIGDFDLEVWIADGLWGAAESFEWIVRRLVDSYGTEARG